MQTLNMPTVRVRCTKCRTEYVDVRLDDDREPMCEEPCAPPHMRIHEEPMTQFPTVE